MKKVLVVLSASVSLMVLSCGGGNDKPADADTAATEVTEASPSDNPDYQKGLDLIAKNDCLTCHKVNEASIGPAYQLVANKYENTDATIDTLAHKVIKGGAGNWGQIPMSAHPQVSLDDAKTMVKYVMTLKK